MHKFTKALAAAALTVGLAGTADAQGTRPQPGGRGGMTMGGGAMNVYSVIGTSKALQEELKISDEQKTKLEAVVKANREKTTEAMKGINFREMTEDQRKELTEKMAKSVEENKKAIEGVLTPEQAKRAGQINYQVMGIRAFSNKDVQTALKMSDDQKEKIKTVYEAYQKDARELGGGRGGFGGGKPTDEEAKKATENRKKSEALRAEAEEKIVTSMSDEQKKAWKDMIGEKFDTSKLTPGFGNARPRDN